MFSRKQQVEEIPEELTDIWRCTTEGCNSWMRHNFTFETEPTCPECRSAMVRDTRMLPQLINNARIQPLT